MRVTSKTKSARWLPALMAVMGVGLAVAPLFAQTPPETERISFQIATGPVSGSYLQVGEAIAIIVSHPPGLTRCDVKGVCGPKGLIATTRSSSGSVSNAINVNRGSVQSAIVQGDIAQAAFEGLGPFKDGALTDLRAIARLHDEALHLVVSPRLRLKRLKDLAGKRVGIDISNSATDYTVRTVLTAAGVRLNRLRIKMIPADKAGDEIRSGKLDAFFVIGVAPIRTVDQLIRRGHARLASLDAPAIAALTRKSAMYGRVVLPDGAYRGSKPVTTLSIASVWVVNRSQPAAPVAQLLRSLWNPANRADLQRRGNFALSIDPKRAAENLPLPLHEGAQRFYAEAGR